MSSTLPRSRPRRRLEHLRSNSKEFASTAPSAASSSSRRVFSVAPSSTPSYLIDSENRTPNSDLSYALSSIKKSGSQRRDQKGENARGKNMLSSMQWLVKSMKCAMNEKALAEGEPASLAPTPQKEASSSSLWQSKRRKPEAETAKRDAALCTFKRIRPFVQCDRHARPSGIARLPDGTIIIADEGNGDVFAVDPDARMDAWEMRRRIGSEDFNWILPQGVCPVVLPGRLPAMGVVVSDGGRHQIVLTKLGSARENATIVLAGSGKRGHLDGPVSVAQFNSPAGVCVLESGEILVADTGNHAIRCIRQHPKSGAFIVCTLAGGAKSPESSRMLPGFKDGGGKRAMFSSPKDVCVDAFGQILVADSGNRSIRIIKRRNSRGSVESACSSPFAQEDPLAPFMWRASACVVRTLVGRPAEDGESVAVDGEAAHARLECPAHLCSDPETRTLYIVDGCRVRALLPDSDGSVSYAWLTTCIGKSPGTALGGSITLSVRRRKGKAPPSPFKNANFIGPPELALLNKPCGICMSAGGGVIVADTRNSCVRIAESGPGGGKRAAEMYASIPSMLVRRLDCGVRRLSSDKHVGVLLDPLAGEQGESAAYTLEQLQSDEVAVALPPNADAHLQLISPVENMEEEEEKELDAENGNRNVPRYMASTANSVNARWKKSKIQQAKGRKKPKPKGHQRVVRTIQSVHPSCRRSVSEKPLSKSAHAVKRHQREGQIRPRRIAGRETSPRCFSGPGAVYLSGNQVESLAITEGTRMVSTVNASGTMESSILTRGVDDDPYTSMRRQVESIKARNRSLAAQNDDLENLLQSSLARMEKVRSMIASNDAEPRTLGVAFASRSSGQENSTVDSEKKVHRRTKKTSADPYIASRVRKAAPKQKKLKKKYRDPYVYKRR